MIRGHRPYHFERGGWGGYNSPKINKGFSQSILKLFFMDQGKEGGREQPKYLS
jgi:hypothetical protein